MGAEGLSVDKQRKSEQRSGTPLRGRENLRTRWWVPLPRLVESGEVLDTFVNGDLSAVTVEFHCRIVDPPCPLRIVDRFRVNSGGDRGAGELLRS